MRKTIMALFVALTVAACGDDTDATRSTDFSRGLVSFGYNVTQGMGLCVEPGMLYSVRVISEDGTLTLSGSRIDEGHRGQEPCIPTVNSGACLVERAVAARSLTIAEADRLLDLFDGVHIEPDRDPDCGTEDFCTIDHYIWINRTHDRVVTTSVLEDPCAPKLAKQDSRAIKSALDDLLQ